MLVLAWKLDAQSMGYFTRQEWLRGMGSLQYVTYLPHFVILHAVFMMAVLSLPLVLQSVRLHLRLFPVIARCDSTERLRNSLDYLRSVLNDSTSFKLIYRYAFDFARVSQANQIIKAKMLTCTGIPQTICLLSEPLECFLPG